MTRTPALCTHEVHAMNSKTRSLKVGIIGLGNVGGKLPGSLLRDGVGLTAHDLNADLVAVFVAEGVKDAVRPLGRCAIALR